MILLSNAYIAHCLLPYASQLFNLKDGSWVYLLKESHSSDELNEYSANFVRLIETVNSVSATEKRVMIRDYPTSDYQTKENDDIFIDFSQIDTADSQSSDCCIQNDSILLISIGEYTEYLNVELCIIKILNEFGINAVGHTSLLLNKLLKNLSKSNTSIVTHGSYTTSISVNTLVFDDLTAVNTEVLLAKLLEKGKPRRIFIAVNGMPCDYNKMKSMFYYRFGARINGIIRSDFVPDYSSGGKSFPLFCKQACAENIISIDHLYDELKIQLSCFFSSKQKIEILE